LQNFQTFEIFQTLLLFILQGSAGELSEVDQGATRPHSHVQVSEGAPAKALLELDYTSKFNGAEWCVNVHQK
jgi:hypothetical protein